MCGLGRGHASFRWLVDLGRGCLCDLAAQLGFFCHIYADVALVALVIFRLLWGLFVSEPVRFSSFVTTPRVVIRNLIHLFQGEPGLWIGHNPAGR